MTDPSPQDYERLRRLEKSCLFLLELCQTVHEDWTRLAQLQEKLPEIASTMNKSMLEVMAIPNDDDDEEHR